jgi:hypothetical protein
LLESNEIQHTALRRERATRAEESAMWKGWESNTRESSISDKGTKGIKERKTTKDEVTKEDYSFLISMGLLHMS